MNACRLSEIRAAEKASHIEIYSDAKLYEEGSWLQKPIKTVLDLIPLFSDYSELNVLDLGSGVGRNCIPIAKQYQGIPCTVECVDILDLAIEKLQENVRNHGVDSNIKGIVTPLEEYAIAENHYDLIMAVSALEHIDSEEAFVRKLKEIRKGIRENGIVCLVINSDVVELDKSTGEELSPQFEVNLATKKLQQVLENTFYSWEVLKQTVRRQQYDIPREGRMVALTTDVVTYVAKK